MPTVTKKQENTAFQIQPHTTCSVCTAPKEEILLSCANFDCDHKVHVSCALRPEGTRLHFCSPECVKLYADR